MDKYRICCVTYKSLDDLVRKTVENLEDDEVEIEVVNGLREKVLPEIERKIFAGTEIILAGGANAKIIKDFCNIPVLDYQINSADYLWAVEGSRKAGERVAIVTYQEPLNLELKRYLDAIHVMAENIIYGDTQELISLLDTDRFDSVIGGAHALEVAEKLGKKAISIYPGQSAIRDTILQAKEILKNIRAERRNSLFNQALVDYSINGILMTDVNGCILNYNAGAEKFFEGKRQLLKGSYLQTLFPESRLDDFVISREKEATKIINLQGKELLQRWIRIADKRGAYQGNICTLSDVSDLQKLQWKYKEKETRERKEKGFLSKYDFSDIIGSSYKMKECIADAKFFAGSDANVLIYGETGVGKEILAQSIHRNSKRGSGPFIGINCAALPENLLESELFGYDEGAFTGGKRGGKKGLFELAENGTLFLDEIGEINIGLQSRLLRVLQEKEIMHIGGDRVIPINARIISATNRNLELCDPDFFRRDLLYRLNILEIKLPPLRERKDDVLELFEYFYRKKGGGTLSDEVKQVLLAYSWPGNVRELQNVCERYYLYMSSNVNKSAGHIRRCMVKSIGEDRLFRDIVNRYQGEFSGKDIPDEMLKELLSVFRYNREQLAARLGISRTTLWRKEKENK
ncbi:MAG: sigma 54-interacting transcriptional regulator [Lachnospiraceae bacterium]|nr:sigma 54-interacting transcriptional regulator [Lachnospiraceae bacterium]